MNDGLHAWLDAMDRMRGWQGRLLDAVRLGPQETPYRVLLQRPGVRLRHYPQERPGAAALLIVAAPIKRHYIWDLFPERSVVRRARAAGLDVFLLEWTDDAQGDELDLQACAGRAIDECLDTIAAQRPGGAVCLAGHSLGGTLAALYAAWRPRRAAKLVLLEAPLRFGEASGAFRRLLALGVPGHSLVPAAGRVPGSLLNLASVAAAPTTFVGERQLDRLASAAAGESATHWRVERWTLDEFAMPPRLFEEVVERLYRGDEFMRGRLAFAGTPVRPSGLTSPVLAVHDPRSRIVPVESIEPAVRALGSREKLLLAYPGDVGVALQHVGVLVGARAHRELWPRILAWLGGQP